MTTQKGTVKKTAVSAYKNIRKTGIIAIKLNTGDVLKFVKTTSGKDNILIVTKLGQAIYFKESDVRPMGRSTAGVRGIKLRASDCAISSDVVPEGDDNSDLLTVLENGYGKRTIVEKHFHTQNRGGSGLRASKVSEKTGTVVEAIVTNVDNGDIVMISRQGQMIRLPLKSVKRLGRDTMGVTLMRLKARDKVASVALVVEKEEEIVPENGPNNEKLELKVVSKETEVDIEVKGTEKAIQNTEKNIETVIEKPITKPKKDNLKTKANNSKESKTDTTSKSSPNYWGGENTNK